MFRDAFQLGGVNKRDDFEKSPCEDSAVVTVIKGFDLCFERTVMTSRFTFPLSLPLARWLCIRGGSECIAATTRKT